MFRMFVDKYFLAMHTNLFYKTYEIFKGFDFTGGRISHFPIDGMSPITGDMPSIGSSAACDNVCAKSDRRKSESDRKVSCVTAFNSQARRRLITVLAVFSCQVIWLKLRTSATMQTTRQLLARKAAQIGGS